MAFTHLEERVLMHIGKHSVSISEIHESFFGPARPSRRAVQRALKALVKKKAILQTGVLKGTRYEKVR